MEIYQELKVLKMVQLSSSHQPPSCLNWAKELENKRILHDLSTDSDAFWDCVSSKFLLCHSQFSAYANEMSVDQSNSSMSPNELRELIVQTRGALRFGLNCLSIEPRHRGREKMIRNIQCTTVTEYRWHEPLAALLSCRRGDSKCRTIAARLLSNLVTSNDQSAIMVSSNILISPSSESVSSCILETIHNAGEISSSGMTITEANWVDMILSAAKARNREAIGAVVATLHNCMFSLVIRHMSNIDDIGDKFLRDIASNGMLISTLLRQFIAAEAITDLLSNEMPRSEERTDHWDSATDWIQLLLSRLAKWGMFPSMFASINFPNDNTSFRNMLPEQVVLLYCISREANNYVMECYSDNGVQNPFVREVGVKESAYASYTFLAHLVIDLSPWFRYKRLPETIEMRGCDRLEDGGFNYQLMQTGFLLVNDILASVLGVDSPLNESLRLQLRLLR